MPRYINTKTLPQKRYTDSKKLASSIADYMIAFDNGWNACIDEIGKQSTVSSDEVRGVGKWINAWINRNKFQRCSECGAYLEDTFFAHDYSVNYCPNCGARMMEVE